ncbi:DUF4251 domain-containing protein [Joostella sp. CR20]|uniref:DUF4251 domain-containing protein n=1 Tax=Joostella sp. CR20 TaxID=2804312 RepID=UPI00313A822C
MKVVFKIMVICLLVSCGSTQDPATVAKELEAVDALLKEPAFRIENQWAMPQISSSMVRLSNSGIMGPGNNLQRVDLTGNANYLEIKGDSAKAYLPFFGERQMGGGYNTDGEAIQFDQKINDLSIEYLQNKQRYRVAFTAQNGTESFDITLFVFPNKKTSLSVNSTQRDHITYDGLLSEIPQKQ